MITKRCVIDSTEILSDGSVQLRIAKQVIDGETILMSEPHRTVVYPGMSIDDQMGAVNANLESMGWPQCDEFSEAKKYCEIAHTPERIARRLEIDSQN